MHTGLLFHSLFAQDVNLRFRHLTVDNGLSHTDATCITQDGKGFIWIGTYSGLNRHDGYSTKVYYNNTERSKNAYFNRIASISLGSNNLLWLATEGGLALFDPGVMNFRKISLTTKSGTDEIVEPLQKVLAIESKMYTVSAKKIIVWQIDKKTQLTHIKKIDSTIQWPVFDIKKDSQSKGLWVAHAGGLSFLREDNSEVKLNFAGMQGAISAISTDMSGKICFNNNIGLFSFDVSSLRPLLNKNKSVFQVPASLVKQISSLPTGLSSPVNIRTDTEGNFWMATSVGLKKVNPHSGELFSFFNNEYSKTSLSANSVSSVFIDKSSCLWVTTFGGGVNIADLNQKSFGLLQRMPNSSNTLSANYTRAILEDEKENLWIGTRNGGLNYYQIATGKYTQYHPSNSGIQSDNIRSLVKDKSGRLWVGTEVGISVRNTDGSFDNLKPGAGGNNSFVSGNYFSLGVDVFGQVWAGAWNNGLCRINYKGKNNFSAEQITHTSSLHKLLSSRITFVYADTLRPEVLVGTDHGLNHIYLNNDGSVKKITNYHGSGKNVLSSEFVWPIIRQGDSIIWVGTLGGGLNKIKLQRNGAYVISQIVDKNSKALRDIESMQMDDDGNLWLAGNVLAKYSPQKNEFVYYDVNDGLQGNSFKIGAAWKGRSGKLYFGGTGGVTYFKPQAIVSNQTPPLVAFTNLLINGMPAENGSIDEKVISSISYTDKLKLTASENNFAVQFSAMHYANPERCKFRYKLIGYDNDWRYTDATNRFAAYSNLDYGVFTLKVEAANNDGVWTSKAEELQINILAPWWKTTTAKIIYFLSLLGIIYLVWHYQHSWFNLKRKLQYRELEEKKQEELHQMKLQFFTNISHEFRTPLTLILGPTEKMLHQETKEEEQQNYLRLIYSNARRLLGLINELMDFRQAETDSLKLKVMEGNLSKFIKGISTEFKEMAAERDILYSIKEKEKTVTCYFDPNITEKIVVNLLSNAFKYTEKNGAIEVEVLDSIEDFRPKYSNQVHIKPTGNATDFVWIRIADTGIGITGSSINSIFDRYFRVNTLGHEKHLGTGVGLALVKSLVELHKGELRVYSERNEGSEFLVGFPASINAYSKLEVLDDIDHQIDFENLQYTIDWIDSDLKKEEGITDNAVRVNNGTIVRKRILIVEDNEEMRRFLVNSLSDEYEVLEAADGNHGLKKAKDHMPDLIVSDLMMPEMDGNELCKKIREDIATSHTPFILISAKATVETHIEGAESGADIYFPKPFSLRLLQVTIQNLFSSRAKLKEKYNKDVFAETREVVTNQKDKEFLDELISIIEINMEDENLDVEMICKKIGMSRTKLYGKVKAVTGQPIGEFTRVLRLKKAAKIMVSEDIPILEVMYRVGIQSQSYFTKAFKIEFGKTPSAFLNEFKSKAKQLGTPANRKDGTIEIDE